VLQSFATEKLRCPACHRNRTLRLEETSSDEREVREGTLICSACGAQRPVHRGVGELLDDPPAHVSVEAAGLERFAEVMRADGWTPERIRSLPFIENGYWYVQATSIQQLFDVVDLQPGQWVLDLGSNTCWASNYFASRGLNAVALDISLWELQGLWTADYFLDAGDSYFERVLASMNEIPIATGSLDYVYACEVLHHNDLDGLRATFEEAFRVLKPGGRMLVVNETLKTRRDPDGVHTEGVAQFEGYEHAHWAWRYRWEATRAGFLTRLLEPRYNDFFSSPPPDERPPLLPWRARAWDELRRRPVGHKIILPYLNHVRGEVSFGMIATKPTGPVNPGMVVRPLRRALAATGPRRRAVRSG
jgi:SAM-dependent methyltransferase